MTQLNIALFQAAPGPRTVDRALADLDTAMRRAVKRQANLLVTPELFLSGYGDASASIAAAQEANSEVLRAAAQTAARHGIGLVLGYPERDGGNLFNSAAVFDRRGARLHNYRKVALPNEFERGCFQSGNGPEVFEFEGVRCSVVICYDVEFPELPRRAARLGAEIMIVPTALRRKWRIVSDSVVPTRAYENAIFVAYCDYARHGSQSEFSGASTICGPTGARLTVETGQPGLVFAKIDTHEIARHRQEFDLLNDMSEPASFIERLFQYA